MTHRDTPDRPPHLVDDGYLVELGPVPDPYLGWELDKRPIPHRAAWFGFGVCVGILVFALVWTFARQLDAAPSSSPESTLPVDLSGQWSTPATSGAPLDPALVPAAGLADVRPTDAPQPAAVQPSAGAHPASVPAPSYSASATWCAWGSHRFIPHPTIANRCVWTDGRWSACKASPAASCHRAALATPEEPT